MWGGLAMDNLGGWRMVDWMKSCSSAELIAVGGFAQDMRLLCRVLDCHLAGVYLVINGWATGRFATADGAIPHAKSAQRRLSAWWFSPGISQGGYAKVDACFCQSIGMNLRG